MASAHNRRQFMRDAGLIAAGAAGGLAGGFFPVGAPAVEPVQRTHKARFKFSLAAYSFRKQLSGENPEMTLDDFIRQCADFELDATELTSYYFPAEPTDEYLRKLKGLCFRLGLDVSGTAIRNDFCFPAGPEREKEIAHVKKWIEHADVLGAPVIRVFSGKPHGKQTQAEAHKLAVDAMQECCEHAARHGVYLALENHGGLTTNIDDLLQLVKDVKSPWFGINFDSGNFQGDSDVSSAYEDMARMAPYALNVQIKVMIALKGGKQPTDFNRIASILRDSGYRGYVVLEYEENEPVKEACRRNLDELRRAFDSSLL
jgi:sugar phosphate isomerase/epimerase